MRSRRLVYLLNYAHMVPLNVNSQANEAGYNRFCYDVWGGTCRCIYHPAHRLAGVPSIVISKPGLMLRFVRTLNEGREIPCALALVEVYYYGSYIVDHWIL